MGLIEGLGVDVLFEDPQVQTGPLRPRDDGLGRQRQQTGSDAPTLVSIGNMEIVEQRALCRVVVEQGAGEAHKAAIVGDDCATAWIGLAQQVGPYGQAVGDDVPVEECVRVGAPVVTTPAVSVKLGDGLGIGEAGWAEARPRQGGASTVRPRLRRARQVPGGR